MKRLVEPGNQRIRVKASLLGPVVIVNMVEDPKILDCFLCEWRHSVLLECRHAPSEHVRVWGTGSSDPVLWFIQPNNGSVPVVNV